MIRDAGLFVLFCAVSLGGAAAGEQVTPDRLVQADREPENCLS